VKGYRGPFAFMWTITWYAHYLYGCPTYFTYAYDWHVQGRILAAQVLPSFPLPCPCCCIMYITVVLLLSSVIHLCAYKP